jgi:hypothetical protein
MRKAPETTKAKADETTETPTVIKTTINLTPDAAAVLKELASSRGTSVAEVIRRAIWIEKYLHDAMKKGGKVLLQEPDEPIRELVIR